MLVREMDRLHPRERACHSSGRAKFRHSHAIALLAKGDARIARRQETRQ